MRWQRQTELCVNHRWAIEKIDLEARFVQVTVCDEAAKALTVTMRCSPARGFLAHAPMTQCSSVS